MNISKLYKKAIITVCSFLCLFNFGACSDYLNVVPDGTGRLENVFTSRESALRYLYSNYSFLQKIDPMEGLEVTGVGELWTYSEPKNRVINTEGIKIAEGRQTPYVNLFNRWTHIFAAINNCNTMIKGLGTYTIPYLPDWERDLWIAENKVLKAWYHFYLLRMYGPIPIIRENLPVSTDVEKVQVPRESVDDVVNYIVQLLDEAMPYLYNKTSNPQDYGRIDRSIALSIRAQVLVTAASPLFNCNTEMASLKNKDGLQLFSQDKEQEQLKWKLAAEACDSALVLCMETLGMELYKYPGHQTLNLSPTMEQQLTLRQSFCERWSSEVIWAHTKSWVRDLQFRSAKSIGTYAWSQLYGVFGAPFSMVEQFYSDNGIPIKEDRDWDYNARYDMRIGTAAENLYIRQGETTAEMNFNREPRFYAWLAFDRGVFYGWGFENDATPSNLLYYKARNSEQQGGSAFSSSESGGAPTGYYPKKYMHYKTQGTGDQQLSVENYIWPIMRLPELMLYYAEAINETEDTPAARSKAIHYLDMIRERAGLEPVADSWTKYSSIPEKYTTQSGLRSIIQQERTIELMFEGQRYWDLRRWKTAPEVLNGPVQGWNMGQKAPEYYYKPYTIFEQKFGLRDYFFPIPDTEMRRNMKLVQNLGWN